MSESRLNFPFSAVVDQERLKLALLLNAVNPSIGGLLVRGPKGSGKSVAVRALGDLLPQVEIVADCPFNCSPGDPSNMCGSCRSRRENGENLPVKKRKMRVMTLPLGSTEDRVVGTLDMEKALREGVKALQPGIMAEANQNVLYVDEINLLPDHIVDDLLDAAASGWNVVEREGISVAHPSRFILVGTMNPEEGELRPQLLDRLSISVTLSTVMDVDKRVEIVKRNLEFRRDPSAFTEKYSSEQENLRNRILKAKELLMKTRVPDPIIYLASAICARLEVDGQRPDIIMAEVARTIAALNGRSEIIPQDVLEAAKLALNHRTRKGGFLAPPTEKEIEEAYNKNVMYAYRSVEAQTSGKKIGGESPQTLLQGSPAEQPSNAKSKSLSSMSETKPEVKEDIDKSRKEGNHLEGSGELEKKNLQGSASSSSLFLIFVLGSILTALFVGLGLYYRVNPSYLGLALFFLAVSTALVLWMRKRRPLVLQASALRDKISKGGSFTTKIRLFRGTPLGKRGAPQKSRHMPQLNLRSKFSNVKGFFTEKSELFKGVPLGRKQKTWIDSRFRMLPDVRLKSRKRSFLAGKRGITLTTLTRGRYRSYEKPSKPAGDIAFFPTIQAAATNRHINLEGIPKISVHPEDVRTKIREYRAPATVVLVLDISGSMANYLGTLAKAVDILNREAYRKRDRLALIAFKGDSAYVLNDPTTNIDVVAGNIKRLKASWFTPLADGMMKALEVVRNERRRNKDVIPLVVVISDFLPNIPLKMPGHVDGVADTLYVAKLLKQNKIPLLALRICSAFWIDAHDNIYLGGSPLVREIAKITGGRYYEISPSQSSEKLEEIISEAIYEFNTPSTSPLRIETLQ